MKKLTMDKTIYLFARKNFNRLGLAIFFFFSFFLFSKDLLSSESNIKNPFSEYSADLKQIENYLNKITNLSANFVQKTSDGSKVKGKFFLSRPGKMRIEYLTKPEVVIVVNGSVLSYYDVELDEISHLSTNTTPASFLTRPSISFNAKDLEVTDIKKFSNQIKISIIKKNRKEAGEFSLVFTTNPLSFIKMEVKNDLDQIIEVILTDIDFTNSITDKIFTLKKASE